MTSLASNTLLVTGIDFSTARILSDEETMDKDEGEVQEIQAPPAAEPISTLRSPSPFEEPDEELMSSVAAGHRELAALMGENHLRKIEPYILTEVQKLMKKAVNLLKVGPGLRIPRPINARGAPLKPNKKFEKQPAFKRKIKSQTARNKKKKELIEVQANCLAS
jgi:hypothetical protein